MVAAPEILAAREDKTITDESKKDDLRNSDTVSSLTDMTSQMKMIATGIENSSELLREMGIQQLDQLKLLTEVSDVKLVVSGLDNIAKILESEFAKGARVKAKVSPDSIGGKDNKKGGIFSTLFAFLTKPLAGLKKSFSGGIAGLIGGFKNIFFAPIKALKSGGKLLLGAAKKFFLPLAILFSAFEAFKGFNNAAEISGKLEKDLTLADKVMSAISSVISGLTFGLLDTKKVFEFFEKSDFLGSIKEGFQDMLRPEGLITQFIGLFNALKTNFIDRFKIAKETFLSLFEEGAIFPELFKFITAIGGLGLDVIKGIFKTVVSGFSFMFGPDGLLPSVGGLFNDILGFIADPEGLFRSISDSFKLVFGSGGIIPSILGLVTDIVNGTTGSNKIIVDIKKGFDDFGNSLDKMFIGLMETIDKILNFDPIDFIISKAKAIGGAAVDFFTGLLGGDEKPTVKGEPKSKGRSVNSERPEPQFNTVREVDNDSVRLSKERFEERQSFNNEKEINVTVQAPPQQQSTTPPTRKTKIDDTGLDLFSMGAFE